jgi:hypothetical protein
VALSFGVELRAIGVREAGEIGRDVAAFALLEWKSDCDGEHFAGGSSQFDHVLAARYQLPTVYSF